MRDIKFRCWNAFSNHMHEWSEMVEKNKIHLLSNENKSYICEQYTGLKDKNGVEIYEGDILTGGVSGHVKPLVVEWSVVRRGSNVNGATTHSGFNISEYYITFSKCRVIGNIHQNPELLGD